MTEQRTLTARQLEHFYEDPCVNDQLSDFELLLTKKQIRDIKQIFDLGGGVGHFALAANQKYGAKVTVLDLDSTAIARLNSFGVEGVEGVLGNATQNADDSYGDVACFNLILHHLVGKDETTTETLQAQALNTWKNSVRFVFVNEYVYESFFKSFSSRLIYEITKSQILSSIASVVSSFIPALRANTFGVGVRFRSDEEWRALFESCNLEVAGSVKGRAEPVSLAWRFLLIKTVSRDSYLLKAA